MDNITDKKLLLKVVELCEALNKEELSAVTKHPLDAEIKDVLNRLVSKIPESSDGNLSYMESEEIDDFWNELIEKSIICLRYFDKREPFSENGKVPYAYGLEELIEYHKKYIDFEGVMYGGDMYYRDHVFHVIRVWLLGVYILLTENQIITRTGIPLIEKIHFEGEAEAKAVSKQEYEEEGNCKKYKEIKTITGETTYVNVNNFSSSVNKLEKLSIWTLTALCHDLGYPLEKSKKILAKTEQMLEVFVSQPNITGNLQFSVTKSSINQDIILFASKKMKVEDVVPIQEEQESTTTKKLVTYNASIQEKYKFKYQLSLDSFAHGIMSSIIIYKMLNYFKETDNNTNPNYVFQEEDARQFYIRRDILRAMASHTCRDIYHIDVATFPMLLFVCDELQEWGRKSWKNLYKGTSNNTVDLTLKEYNCNEIVFEEKINMEKSMTAQLVDNLERIFKKQYLLYKTTFRDGQDTAKRKFNFRKSIEINIDSQKYKSIKQIKIDFGIYHDKEDEFKVKFLQSGENPANDTESDDLIKEIRSRLEKYEKHKNKKYGQLEIDDEREAK